MRDEINQDKWSRITDMFSEGRVKSHDRLVGVVVPSLDKALLCDAPQSMVDAFGAESGNIFSIHGF